MDSDATRGGFGGDAGLADDLLVVGSREGGDRIGLVTLL
jgi:hypothetical protein